MEWECNVEEGIPAIPWTWWMDPLDRDILCTGCKEDGCIEVTTDGRVDIYSSLRSGVDEIMEHVLGGLRSCYCSPEVSLSSYS